MANPVTKSWPDDATIYLPKLLACGLSPITISKLLNRSQEEVWLKLSESHVPSSLFSETTYNAAFRGKSELSSAKTIYEGLSSGMTLGEVARAHFFISSKLVNVILDSNMLNRLSLNDVKKEHNLDEPASKPVKPKIQTAEAELGPAPNLLQRDLQKFSSGASSLHAMRAEWLKFRLQNGTEKELSTWLQGREINEMFHFSPLANLESILRQGLITIRELKLAKATFKANDHDRFDNTGGICTSLGFPNYKLLYRAQGERDLSPVILKISPLALFEIAWIAVPTNAAGKEMRNYFKGQPEKLIGITALTRMFEESVSFSDSNEVTRSQLGLPVSFPTDPQAEVIFLERIPTHYILALCVPDETTESLVKGVLAQSGIPVEIEIRADLFSNRVDWQFWVGKRIRLEKP
jgi:hypothetical protein